ncbi:MAG: hypothetical protein HQL30_12630 [Candidatus Omnitrophica bacterium]|nr:hypothetical protein [Candidatus Omnitrophota bacterium]
MSDQGNELNKQSKSKFIEKWAYLEHVNGLLVVILWAFLGLILVLLIALCWVNIRPKPIYYISAEAPGAGKTGIAYPSQISDSSIISFATSWVLNWSNFTPATVQDMHTRAVKYMAPGLLSKTMAKIDSDVRDVLSNNISSIFTLVEDPRLVSVKSGYQVSFRGEKVVYIGKEKMVEQNVLFSVDLLTVPSTEVNPYGLLVSGIKQKTIEG